MNLKWPIVVVKIAKLILTHAIRLAMRTGNIVVRHFQLGSFHLKDWTRVYDLMTSKVSDFSHPRKLIKRVRSKKSTLDSGFKKRRFRCADITRPKSYKNVCAFKGTGFLVDGAWVAPCMLLTNCVVLHRKDRASPGKCNKHLFRLRFEWLKTCDMRLPWEWCKSTCMTSYTTVFH